jgi:hypothetical protein
MKISVTLEHIKNGIPSHPHQCPVALAFREAGFTRALVGKSQVRANGYDSPLSSLSDAVKVFVRSFDEKNHVEPFDFEFEVTA